ncbi:hypothetical protein MMC17_004497 [Xylographa soralifera]|nr:hypothetical protein [Xylographa soralifera]
MLYTRIWTAATGNDLGLITRRIKAAAANGDMADTDNQDTAVKFRGPHDLPEIVDACETLVQILKSMRGSVRLAATKFWIRMTLTWNRAWRTKETVMLQLIEKSRSRFGEAQCAMDKVFKRSAQFEARGRSSSSHREMIDETIAYIVGGHETTQDTTKWSMKYLTANQNKQSKLRTVLLELWPEANAYNLPSHQAIVSSEHPYVEASIQELIRIALTAPSWHRRTMQDVVVLGHRIPAGIDDFGTPSIQSLDDMDDFDIKPELRSPTSKPRASGPWLRATKGLFQPERWLDEHGNYDAYAGPMATTQWSKSYLLQALISTLCLRSRARSQLYK